MLEQPRLVMESGLVQPLLLELELEQGLRLLLELELEQGLRLLLELELGLELLQEQVPVRPH